jgi:DNA-binding SARP family transcriptional activator
MPVLEIRFFTGEVRIDGRLLDLPDKEMELLFTVAAAGTINGEQLMDMLWPDADGDSAHNAFRVCLYRLRKRVNCGEVIRRFGKAYMLEDGIGVDVHRLRDGSDATQCLAAIRAGTASRARLGRWFEPFERLLWRLADRRRNVRASDLVTRE